VGLSGPAATEQGTGDGPDVDPAKLDLPFLDNVFLIEPDTPGPGDGGFNDTLVINCGFTEIPAFVVSDEGADEWFETEPKSTLEAFLGAGMLGDSSLNLLDPLLPVFRVYV